MKKKNILLICSKMNNSKNIKKTWIYNIKQKLTNDLIKQVN
jgi:hypothetical protein